jgi:hypothetical protein
MNFWWYVMAGFVWLALLVYLTVMVPRWLRLKPSPKWLLRLLVLPLLLVGSFRFAMWAFGPSEALHAQRAEERRLACLDTWCEGDVQPNNPDHMKYALLKLNGKLFLGPNEYFSSGSAGGSVLIIWWNHKPLSRADPMSPELKAIFKDGKGDQVDIQVFIHRSSGYKNPDFDMEYLQRMEAQGQVMSKTTVRPGLQAWRVNEGGYPITPTWYVATNFVKKAPNGAILYCQGSDLDKNPELSNCTTSDQWVPGISWDTRFSGKHAKDWPEIYPEIIRVLSLLKEIQP